MGIHAIFTTIYLELVVQNTEMRTTVQVGHFQHLIKHEFVCATPPSFLLQIT